MQIKERCRKHIKFSYDCLDRIKIRGYILYIQDPGGIVNYLKNFRKLTATKETFKMITQLLIKNIEKYAKENNIPIIESNNHENKLKLASKHLKQNKEGIFCIIKSQENSTCFGTYQNKNKTHTTITKVHRLVNSYYLYLTDAEFGLSYIKICSYLPFNVEIYLNGHNYIEQQLKKRDIKYKKIDNCFSYVSDLKDFNKICQAITDKKISSFCDKWLYKFVDYFRPFERGMGYRYRYFISQLEYCNNIVFRKRSYLNQLFTKIIDNNKHIGRPDTIKTVFKKNMTKRTKGILNRSILQTGEKPCVKSWYKSCYIKQYNKKGIVLRTETCLNNTRDLYINKSINNLDYVIDVCDNINKRYLKCLDEISLKEIGKNTLENISKTTVKGKKRIAGIKLENKRIMGVIKAVHKNGFLINGFTNEELRSEVKRLLDLSNEEYGAVKMKYDIDKLIAKGLIKKVVGKNRYVICKKIKLGTFLVKVYDIVCKQTLNYLSNDKEGYNNFQSRSDQRFYRIENAINGFMNDVGITA